MNFLQSKVEKIVESLLSMFITSLFFKDKEQVIMAIRIIISAN